MLNTIDEAIADFKDGKVVIVVDDENRENEGDFIASADFITPEIINFMATHGRGLICASLVEDRCDELGLELMVRDNTALHETPFTVSVDLNGKGVTTGISASDLSVGDSIGLILRFKFSDKFLNKLIIFFSFPILALLLIT